MDIIKSSLVFYDTYKKYENEPMEIREARCLEAVAPYYFAPICRGDLFAGRPHYQLCGHSTENTTGGGGILLFCQFERTRKILDEGDYTPEERAHVEEMLEYFKDKVWLNTDVSPNVGIMTDALDEETFTSTTNNIVDMQGRLAGSVIDYDKLVKLGLPGLRNEILKYQKLNTNPERNAFYEGALISIDALIKVCLNYAKQARYMADNIPEDIRNEKFDTINELIYDGVGAAEVDDKKRAIKRDKSKLFFSGGIFDDGSANVGTHIDQFLDNEKWRAELIEMAEILEYIAYKKPSTMRQALQLTWLYTIASKVANFGRMDTFIGDFYVNDIKTGVLTEEKALQLVQSYWKMTTIRRISARETSEFNARVVLGGRGRRNTDNADKFAILAMEATRTVIESEPQLTLRIYNGMNPAILQKAYDVIAEGRIYPMLYNDDVNVPAVMKAFNVPENEAILYYPYGCGEYALEHTSVGSPNCGFNILMALEATLHSGYSVLQNKKIGLNVGHLSDFDSWEKLWTAYTKQIEYFSDVIGKRHQIEYQVETENYSFPLIALLYDGCLEKGLSAHAGGCKYRGSIIEAFGLVNTGDSLNVIKQLVYDKKLITLERLVAACDANFEGYEKEYHMIKSITKYGNDDKHADEMVAKVCNHLADYSKSTKDKFNLDYFLIVSINNWYNVEHGKNVAASAEGRKCGEPLANGNSPTAGNDTNGPTAMLNSLVKMRVDNHAGYSQNMKFNKALLKNNREKFEALMSGYWNNGGAQAMITVVDAGDLERAMIEPEKYANLIVRVGGFSARFIELNRSLQQDLLNRTLHEV